MGAPRKGALCTADGRALGSAPAASIAGPGPVLAGFELVDLGAGGQRTALTDGMELTLSDASGGNYGIVAAIATGETVGSVGFVLDRPGGDPDVTRTESWAPYSLYGDGGENAIAGAPLRAGRYTLTATAHAQKNLGGRGARHAERVVHGAGGGDGDARADAADGGVRAGAGGA